MVVEAWLPGDIFIIARPLEDGYLEVNLDSTLPLLLTAPCVGNSELPTKTLGCHFYGIGI